MVRKTIQESTKGLGLAVKSLYADMIPSNRLESTIFFSTLIWFLLFSIFFSFYVDLSEDQVELMGYDTFFYIGGDYPKLHLSKLLSWNLRHPCFVIFNLPSLIIDALLFYKLHVFVFSFISCIISSLSNLMIFKICREIGADKWATITAIILFPTFAHVILLSGQPETFVFTMFFMVLLILSAVLKHSNYYTDSILFLFLTGTTLTNCVKFLFVKIWEENGNIYNAIKRTTRSSWLFCIMFLLTAAGLVYRIVYKHIPLNDAIFNDTKQILLGLVSFPFRANTLPFNRLDCLHQRCNCSPSISINFDGYGHCLYLHIIHIWISTQYPFFSWEDMFELYVI